MVVIVGLSGCVVATSNVCIYSMSVSTLIEVQHCAMARTLYIVYLLALVIQYSKSKCIVAKER